MSAPTIPDLTQRCLELEKELQRHRDRDLLLDESSDPIFSFEPDGTYRYVNKSFAAPFNIPASEIIGKKIWDLFSREEAEKRFAMVKKVFATGQTEDIEVRVPTPSGDLYFLTTVKPIKTADGSVSHIICISKNITEMKRVRSELERAKQETEQANEALRAANQRLELLSQSDGLTGLFNRRYFDSYLTKECARHRRNWGALTLIMCDIDHFKAYNDTYGHQAGDDCIRTAANAIRDTLLRASDVPVRYGGEEFAVILPSTDLHGGTKIAERIRKAIQACAITHSTSSVGLVTMSFGVATLEPGSEYDANRLVQRADNALYASKDAGRNLVTSAEQEADGSTLP